MIPQPLDAPVPVNCCHNPLVMAANPLLNIIPSIRHAVSHDDPLALRQQLIDGIRQFEINSQRAGLPFEVIVGARYCLCTALDEAAALTPWGSQGVWPGHGLLVTFHNETWGGEKFFQLLARLSQNPREHICLLELINFCLQLGFEGRYRVVDNGLCQLAAIKQRLLQMIHSVRGGYDPALSPHASDQPFAQAVWRPAVPLWACAALAGLLACLLWIALNWRLSDDTRPLLAALYQTRLPEIALPHAPPVIEPVLNLRAFLQQEIQQGWVAVRDKADRSVVTLHGDGLFASAATTVRSEYLPVLARIAQAMNNVSGQITVTGYSDNMPIRSARFASNYALSLARAESVRSLLQVHLSQPERVSAQGRGDSYPVAPNDNEANRARNRRVEITLLVSPEQTQTELNRLAQGI